MPFLLSYTGVVVGLGSVLAMVPLLFTSPQVDRLDEAPRALATRSWVAVRSAAGSWYLNGEPVSSALLARTLREESPRPEALLLMPSRVRSAADVSADLRWLRRQSTVPVRLDHPRDR